MPFVLPSAEALKNAPDVMTSAQVATVLRCSKTQLQSLIRTGELSPIHQTSEGPPLFAKPVIEVYYAALEKRKDEGLEQMMRISEEIGLYEFHDKKLLARLRPNKKTRR